jgi:hypothetical protein
MTAWLERIFAFWAIVAVCAMLIMIAYAYVRPVVRAVWGLVGRVVMRAGD